MNFNIRMGIPEMQELWLDLQEKYRSGNIKKKEEQLYKKWGKALKLLSADPGYPSLQTHEIELLSRRLWNESVAVLSGKQNQWRNENVLGLWTRPERYYNYRTGR